MLVQPTDPGTSNCVNLPPLDRMNPSARAINDRLMRYYAEVSARLPLHKVDACPEDVLNRIIWYAQKGPEAQYPKWAGRRERR